MAVEGCTGWRYVVEEITAAGYEAHRRRAGRHPGGTGQEAARQDRPLRRSALARVAAIGELPESWIPPTAVLEWRERVRLYKSLVDQRRVWTERIHAELFQHGVAVPEAASVWPPPEQWLTGNEVNLSPAGRQRVRVGYSMLEATDSEAQAVEVGAATLRVAQLRCRALVDANYGIGGLIAAAVWSELGDCRRFSRSDQVVRHTGLDVSVDSSIGIGPVAI